MGRSSMLLSRNLHRHLIRHAYAYTCKRNLLTSLNENENENEIERESERKRENQYLVQQECKRSGSTYFALLSTANWDHPLLTFVAPHFGKCHHFTNACHGMVYLSGHDNRYAEEGDELLWMPSTNQFKFLPLSKVPRRPSIYHLRSLPLNEPPRLPLTYPTKIEFYPIGFGFDSKSQDYKVLRFLHVSLENYQENCYYDVHIELYSLKTDTWKDIPKVPFLTHSFDSTPIILNGCIYWRFPFAYSMYEPNVITSFDFTMEEFSWLACPPPQTTRWQCIKLIEIDGKLGIILYNLNKGPDKWGLEFFVLGDDGVSWSKEFDIYGLVGVTHPVLYDRDAHLLFIRGEDREDLFVYDILTKELKKIGLSDGFVDVTPYVVASASAPWA